MVDEFARAGHALLLVALDREMLADIADQLTARYGADVTITQQDLSTMEGCAGVEDSLGNFGLFADILVNNAALRSTGSFEHEEPTTLRRLIDLDVKAVVDLTLRLLPGMVARGSEGVLNVASVEGFLPTPYRATYATAKAFLISFTRDLARQMRTSGVQISVLAPTGAITNGLHGGLPRIRTGCQKIAQNAYRRFRRG